MRDAPHRDRMADLLAAYGAGVGRWPSRDAARAARAALLRDRPFRRHWEAERRLDGLLLAERDRLADDIRRSGAADRLTQRALAAFAPASVAAQFGWGRVAAAVAVAVVLGGAFDLLLPAGSAVDGPATVLVDSLLFGPESVEL